MRKVLVSSLVFFLIIFTVIYKNNNNYRDVYSAFFNEINFIKIIHKIYIQKIVNYLELDHVYIDIIYLKQIFKYII